MEPSVPPDCDLTAKTLELRNAKQALRMRSSRRNASTGLTEWTLHTAMCIAMSFQYDFTPAVQWLASRRRRGMQLCGDELECVLLSGLEEYFLQCDVDTLVTWDDPATTPLPPTVLKTATRFVAEYKLGIWVADRNAHFGVTVSTQRLVHEMDSLAGPSSGLREDTSRSAVRMWALRWRRKFGGRYGRLRTIEPVEVLERRNKACLPNFPPFHH